MFKSGFAFVLSHINVKYDAPIQIIPDHYFRKALSHEIKEIKRMLETSDISDIKMLGIPVPSGIQYDSIVKEIKRGNSCQYEREKLPPEKWKYWVIAFEGNNSKIYDLQSAANLIKNDLQFAFQIFYLEKKQQGNPAGFIFMPTHLREYYSSHEAINSNAVNIEQDEIMKIGEIYDLYKKLPPKYQYIEHSIKNFDSLKRIPKKTELLTIGYFSIIETLITHAPRLNESLDSISHQIKNKLVLLRKRFERIIEYNSYFLNIKEKTLWSLLYSYRSCIAHGGIPDFVNKFQNLKSKEVVLDFLREIIKCLILYSLREPELMADLKNC
ncbi:MAG: hypothetical protein JW715_01440 [Sedimentisphaerales bacterium]|nr:hypothetical protein [Sedimentisphaerales bacterium]